MLYSNVNDHIFTIRMTKVDRMDGYYMIVIADNKSECRSCLQFLLTHFNLPLETPSYAPLPVDALALVVAVHKVDNLQRILHLLFLKEFQVMS